MHVEPRCQFGMVFCENGNSVHFLYSTVAFGLPECHVVDVAIEPSATGPDMHNGKCLSEKKHVEMRAFACTYMADTNMKFRPRRTEPVTNRMRTWYRRLQLCWAAPGRHHWTWAPTKRMDGVVALDVEPFVNENQDLRKCQEYM